MEKEGPSIIKQGFETFVDTSVFLLLINTPTELELDIIFHFESRL